MGKINWVRILSGGVLAAIVIAVFGALVAPMFPETWTAAMTALGSEFTDPTETWPLGSIAAGSAVQLAVGIIIVWTYAAIRPRFGPGPMTAALAGFVVWLIVGMQILSLVVLRSISFGEFLVLHGPYLIGLTLAGMAGGWLYRDSGAESASAKAAPAA